MRESKSARRRRILIPVLTFPALMLGLVSVSDIEHLISL